MSFTSRVPRTGVVQRRRGYHCMEGEFRDDFSEEVAFELGFDG